MNDEKQQSRRHRIALIGGGTAIALGIAAGGIGVGLAPHPESSTTASKPATVQPAIRPWYGSDSNGFGSGGTGSGGSGAGGSAPAGSTPATAAQETGVVTIVSRLDYDSGSEAAGTGIILSRGGEILTNNHVVEGSTSITVTVESTGESYTADVVGTDSSDDVAVLQLVDANGRDVTGLTPATIDGDAVGIGDTVTDVGNAGGTGELVASTGQVTALQQSIQVQDDVTGAAKSLTGLIEVNADVVPGDSGGPLLDAEGEVAGIATAASSGSREVTGYAIPIASALAVAKQIEAGHAGGAVVIGLPAFLGVELANSAAGGSGLGQGGVLLSGVVAGQPAEAAGLAAGDVITSIDGTAVTDADALTAAIAAHHPGDRIVVGYTDASGAAQQLTITLGEGPAA